MINQINLNQLVFLIPILKRLGFTFAKNTIYFSYIKKDKIVGICGILFYKNKAILKNSFVIESERNNGIYSEMVKYRMQIIIESGIKIIEATCTNCSIGFHLKNGAIVIKRYKKYTKIKYLCLELQ